MTIHEQVELHRHGNAVLVDRGMAATIRALWNMGIDTFASCEGPPYIAVRQQIRTQRDLDDMTSRVNGVLRSLGWRIKRQAHDSSIGAMYFDLER